MTRRYSIIHEAPSAPGISLMEVAQVDASDEREALNKWAGRDSSSTLDDGTPCLKYGFGDTILRLYTARPVDTDGPATDRELAECEGHPAGPFDPMGATVYCDGSCQVQS